MSFLTIEQAIHKLVGKLRRLGHFKAHKRHMVLALVLACGASFAQVQTQYPTPNVRKVPFAETRRTEGTARTMQRQESGIPSGLVWKWNLQNSEVEIDGHSWDVHMLRRVEICKQLRTYANDKGCTSTLTVKDTRTRQPWFVIDETGVARRFVVPIQPGAKLFP